MGDSIIEVYINNEKEARVAVGTLIARIATKDVFSLSIHKIENGSLNSLLDGILPVQRQLHITELKLCGEELKKYKMIADSTLTKLAIFLKRCTRLENFNVTYLEISNFGITHVCDALKSLITLRCLHLYTTGWSDEGIETVVKMIPSLNNLEILNFSNSITMGVRTYANILQTLSRNKSIKYMGLPTINGEIQQATLTSIWEPIHREFLQQCKEIGATFYTKNDAFLNVTWDEDSLAKKKAIISRLEQPIQIKKQTAQIQAQHLKQQCEIDTKKRIMAALVSKSSELLDQMQPQAAKALLDFAIGMDDKGEFKTRHAELMIQIKQQQKFTEYELQSHVEERVNAIRNEINHAEQLRAKAKSAEEARLLEKQMEMLRQKERQLNQQLTETAKRQKELTQREQQIEKQEIFLTEQTKQLEQLLSELTANSNPNNDNEILQQQMAVLTNGNKDVDAARMRLASLQKAAREAQDKLKMAEKKQLERVEWLQRQMELYQTKGMSPAQLSYRNYLKDVKHLSVTRQFIDHTQHPLKCFISYAWETDKAANTELQGRLQQLKDDLQMAGMKVQLDIRNMRDDMKKFMEDGINNAHKVLVICTPRLKVRASDPVKNNLQLELNTALAKAANTPQFIVPLIFSGTWSDMPPSVGHLLSVDISKKEDYFKAMASIAPLGLIPMLLGLDDNKRYTHIHNRFFNDLAEFDRQGKV